MKLLGWGIFLFVIVAIVFFAMLTANPRDAYPHEAPSGWQYDISCCSDKDCHELAPEEVKITPTGYEWQGEIIPMNDYRVKPSPDGHFHGCRIGSTPRAMCLYVPPFGS